MDESDMATILVISPEPSVRRMLQLAFELWGFSTLTAIDPADAKGMAAEADGVVLDLVDGEPAQWEGVQKTLASSQAPTAILLPHGWDGKKLPKGVSAAALTVRKPYELMDIVRKMINIVTEKQPKPRKAPPKKKTKPRSKTKKAKRHS